jgi:ribosomal protein L11 methyltransferase
MEYLAYHFTVDPPQPGSEILMAMIADQGFESFDTTETGFIAYINEQEQSFVNLNELEFEDFKFFFTIEKITQKNWNAEWEKNFEPVRIGNLLQIRAPFHEKSEEVELEIVIMPKMSFGTGHHNTTQLMCAAMFDVQLVNKRVLDMGCGTGVLAILAEKLQATSILAVDIDEWSVQNTIENCASNDCTKVVVRQGDIDVVATGEIFDAILANINKNILKKHMREYANKLTLGGNLFLSGFFVTDVEELTALAAQLDLQLMTTKSDAEWAMMLLQKV